MADFESIIRPFLPPVLPTTTLLDSVASEPVKIEAGKGGNGKSMSGSYSLSARWYKDTSVQEIAKK